MGEDNPPEVVFAHTLHETMYWYEHFSARKEEQNIIEKGPDIARQLEEKLDQWLALCNYKPRESELL